MESLSPLPADLPQPHDTLTVIANDGQKLFAIDTSAGIKQLEDGSISVVVMMIGAHPVNGIQASAGRIQIKCKSRQMRIVSNWGLSPEGKVVANLGTDAEFWQVEPHTISGKLYAIVCGSEIPGDLTT